MTNSLYRFALWIEMNPQQLIPFSKWVKEDLRNTILEVGYFEDIIRLVANDKIEDGVLKILLSFMLKDEDNAESFSDNYRKELITMILDKLEELCGEGNVCINSLQGEMEIV